jgi:hypothetical protein
VGEMDLILTQSCKKEREGGLMSVLEKRVAFLAHIHNVLLDILKYISLIRGSS